jgi:hypothetical protein
MRDRNRLDDVLRAAAAPGHPHELADAPEMVDKLRRVRRATPPIRKPTPARHRSQWQPGWLLIKVAAGLAAVVGSGWALTAGIGGQGPAGPSTPSGSFSTTQPGGGSTSIRPSVPAGTPTSTPASSGSPASSSSAATTDSLAGQCHAVLAQPAGKRDRLLDSPAYADLVAAAGGRDQVIDFCQNLAATPSGPPGKPARSH